LPESATAQFDGHDIAHAIRRSRHRARRVVDGGEGELDGWTAQWTRAQ
jgi:hypothetical protein